MLNPAVTPISAIESPSEKLLPVWMPLLTADEIIEWYVSEVPLTGSANVLNCDMKSDFDVTRATTIETARPIRLRPKPQKRNRRVHVHPADSTSPTTMSMAVPIPNCQASLCAPLLPQSAAV